MPTTQMKKGRGADTPTIPMTRSNDAALVRVRNGGLFTDSLAVAREFGRRHGNVLQTLDSLIADGTVSRLDLKSAEYLDGQGKPRRMFELNERGALIAMPYVGGKNSRAGQARLVDAFLLLRERLLSTEFPPGTVAVAAKRSTVLQREPLFIVVSKIVARHHLRFPFVYAQLDIFVGVQTFREMTFGQVIDAEQFAQRWLMCAVSPADWARLAVNRLLLGRESAQRSLFEEAA
ncbi:Rha family transcriptional regulator [Paraburkholderia mimosarum]|uniref:Rha family transcriptional regulator n=1 Tax=Paraburkholderia mimosarum TaxID=312026 RepID=UPI00040DA2A1|nr:Rha family transcriptional regulator [Paraburkholderia mimosarum]